MVTRGTEQRVHVLGPFGLPLIDWLEWGPHVAIYSHMCKFSKVCHIAMATGTEPQDIPSVKQTQANPAIHSWKLPCDKNYTQRTRNDLFVGAAQNIKKFVPHPFFDSILAEVFEIGSIVFDFYQLQTLFCK